MEKPNFSCVRPRAEALETIIPRMKTFATVFLLLLPICAAAQPKLRARDLGVPFDGTPGPLNAITDVNGVEVGMTTLIRGEGR